MSAQYAHGVDETIIRLASSRRPSMQPQSPVVLQHALQLSLRSARAAAQCLVQSTAQDCAPDRLDPLAPDHTTQHGRFSKAFIDLRCAMFVCFGKFPLFDST